MLSQRSDQLNSPALQPFTAPRKAWQSVEKRTLTPRQIFLVAACRFPSFNRLRDALPQLTCQRGLLSRSDANSSRRVDYEWHAGHNECRIALRSLLFMAARNVSDRADRESLMIQKTRLHRILGLRWFVFFLTVVAIGVASSCQRKARVSLVSGAGGTASGKLWISNGNLVLTDVEPGIAYGMVQKPGTGREFSYFLILKHDLQVTDLTLSDVLPKSGSRNDGLKGTTTQTVQVGTAKIDVAYTIELNPAGSEVLQETLHVGDEAVDIAAGRVFLVDLTANPLTIVQRKVALGKNLPATRDTEGVAGLARETLAALKSADGQVRDFLNR